MVQLNVFIDDELHEYVNKRKKEIEKNIHETIADCVRRCMIVDKKKWEKEATS